MNRISQFEWSEINYSLLLFLVLSQLPLIDTSLPDFMLATVSMSDEDIVTIWVPWIVFANKLLS